MHASACYVYYEMHSHSTIDQSNLETGLQVNLVEGNPASVESYWYKDNWPLQNSDQLEDFDCSQSDLYMHPS